MPKNKKRYLIFMGHPAHFHLFKNLIQEFETKGIEYRIVIKTKDILEDLCKSSSWNYTNILPSYRKNNFFSFALSYLKKYIRISKIIRQFRPDLLLGSEPSLTHLGKLFKIPSFVFSEDDVAVIPQFAKIAYPFVDVILSPKSCDAGKWSDKKIAYDGFHKLAYLHPSVFIPNRSLIDSFLPEKYFILRLTELAAYHDSNVKGITKEFALKIIAALEPYGEIFISSEKPLDQDFEKYRLKLPSEFIHHALFYAKMYIGDSQSMAVEAALLGTPGIRFNDFVGKIGVLNELENSYQLSFGFKTSEEQELLNRVGQMIQNESLEEEFKLKRTKLLNDKINVPEFFSWFIQNYPNSKEIMKTNSDFQYTFK